MAQSQQQPPALLKTYFLKITFILLLHVTLRCRHLEDILYTAVLQASLVPQPLPPHLSYILVCYVLLTFKNRASYI